MKLSKLSKKALSAVLASCMLLSVAGCSAKVTTDDTKSTASTASKAAEKKDDAKTDDKKDDAKGKELRFTSWANTGEITVLSRAVDAYNKLQSNVKVVFEPTAGDTYEQKLITALSGGDAWDVFYAGDSTIAKLIENKSILTFNDFFETEDSYCKATDFADGLWGAAKDKDGSIYGIAVDCNPNLLYYQPKMIEEVGAKSPQASYDDGTWTWDAFDEVLSKLQAKEKAGFLLGGDAISVYRFVSGNNGKIWEGDTYKFDDKAKEALQYCADRIADKRFTYSGLLPEGQGEDAQFLSGLCGFINAGKWQTPTFFEAGLEHDYIPYPSKDGTKCPPSLISVAYCSVNKDTKMPDEALKFATYYCSKDGQTARLSSTDGKPGNAIPSINGIDDIALTPKVPEHINYLFDVRANGWALGGDFAKDSNYSGLADELKSILEEIWVNGASVEETVPKLEAKANEMVAQKGK